MTIREAKAIDLVRFIEQLGHAVVDKGHAGEAWFCSPLRHEAVPSFRIDRRTNRWKDFGSGLPQGDILDFVREYGRVVGWEVGSVSATLRVIARLYTAPRATTAATPAPPPVVVRPDTRRHQVTSFGKLASPALRRYLGNRGLDECVAGAYVGEVHYLDRTTDKSYYGLGWHNRAGGIETRNPYIKMAIGPKDVTVVRVVGASRVGTAVFEGMMDFLSYVQLAKATALEAAVIMNGVGLVDKVIAYLRRAETAHPVEGWLQNDEAGLKAAAALMAAVPGMTLANQRYAGFTDLNDYLVASRPRIERGCTQSN